MALPGPPFFGAHHFMPIALLKQPPPLTLLGPLIYSQLCDYRATPSLYKWSIIHNTRIGDFTLSQAAQITGSGIPPTLQDFDRLCFFLLH